MTEAVVTPEAAAPEVASTEQVTETQGFSIPEAYADTKYGEKIKSNDDLWKAYDNSQKLIGDRGAHIPQDGASEEDIASFIDKLDPLKEQIAGKFIKAPDEYTFSDLELPEGVNLSDDLTNEFSALAKDLGLTNDQADKLRQGHIKQSLEREQARQKEMDEQFDTIGKDTWGADYEKNLSETVKMLEGKLSKEVADQLWNASPSVLVPILSLIHTGIDKTKPDASPTETTSVGLSDDQLRSKRQELRKAARENPTKVNIKAFNDIQAQSRGK